MRWLTLAHLTLTAPPLSMISAAAEGGFDSVGVRICPRRPGDDYFVNLIGRSNDLKEVRRVAADRGIRLSNVSAYQFYPEVEWSVLEPIVDAAHELGSKIIVANCFDPDRTRFENRFQRYCEKAAEAGIKIALEFMPYSSVTTLDDAISVINAVPTGNAGLLVDALHLDRSGGKPADLNRLEPRQVVFAQLCDAARLNGPMSRDDLLKEARFSRLPLGAGELPLVAFMRSLPVDVEVEYEVVTRREPQEPLASVAQRARSDLEAFLARTGLSVPR
jgi:sugar phosphate isomerase/epimerase